MKYSQLLRTELRTRHALVSADSDSDSPTVYMRGVFLPDSYAGHPAAITVAEAEKAIRESGAVRGGKLRLVVDSVGGDVSVSQWLGQEIAEYDTTVESRARLYSAATHMAMGAKRIVGAEGSDYLLNFPWMIAPFNEFEGEKYVRELRDTGNNLVGQYLRRVNIKESALRTLMREDRIITAERALEIGFLDEVLPAANAAVWPYARQAPTRPTVRCLISFGRKWTRPRIQGARR